MSYSSSSRLVVVPSEPIAFYEQKGLDWLERYYNPGKMFNEVFAISPLEKGVRQAYGMTIIGITDMRDFSRMLRKLRPDVVRGYGGYWASDLVCSHRLPDIPVVVSVHSTDPKYIHKSVCYADIVICMSNIVAKMVIERGTDPSRVRIMPNRIDTEIFHPILDKSLLQPLSERFPPGKHILHVGKKSKQKNLDTLIRALLLVPEDYHCIFVGFLDATPYRELAQSLGVEHRCFWIESIKNFELPLWYSWCDCMCTPSRWEGFGVVFIEAAACGVPIITSDIAPMNEYLVHNVSACLVKEYQNPKALAMAIQRVCEDDDYRKTLSAGAVQAAKPFDRRIVDAQECAIYREAMNLKKPPLLRKISITAWKYEYKFLSLLNVISPRQVIKTLSRRLKLIYKELNQKIFDYTRNKLPRKLSEWIDKNYARFYFGFLPPPMDGMQNISRMKFLYDAVLNYCVKTSGIALELGVFKGCSLIFLAKACLKKGISQIYGMDLFTGTQSWGQSYDTFKVTINRLATYGLSENIILLRQDTQQCDWEKRIDFLHIDADHEYEAVIKDIRKYIPFVNHGGIVIFDDYDDSHPGVKKAVHELLLEWEEFSIIAVNYQGNTYGSVCLRRS